jgi:eukaryotic-like serine/threonine-protein kinase
MMAGMAESSPISPSSPPVALQLEPGSRLDRYELLAPYARGGMACVWLGRVRGKHGFERIVAVKTILPEYATDPEFRGMMADEARIASAIEHPNVAHIIDVGEDGGVFYLVLEWVDGDSLYTLHKLNDKQKKLLPVPIVLRTMADACRGLHAAHELVDREGKPLNVVHRDVSPHNVLVSSTTGAVKLIDFGVAKAQGRLNGNTSAGIIKGKVRFMSPEQALGGEVDRRADVWSVGASLQYLLTGTYPYSIGNDLEVLMALTKGTPPAPLPKTVHPKIAEVVERALAPDPAARYPTALALSRAIESAMASASARASTTDVVTYLESAARPLRERRQKATELAISAAEGRAMYSDLLQPITPPGESAHSGARTKANREPAPSVPEIVAAARSDGSAPSFRAALARPPATPLPPEASPPPPTPPVMATHPVAAPAADAPRSNGGRAAVAILLTGLLGASVAVAWWAYSHATPAAPTAPVVVVGTATVAAPPVAPVAPPPASAAAAPVATGPTPAVVSIEDLPVAPSTASTAAPAPPPRPRWTPPPPPAAPAGGPAAVRNFGF